MTAELRMTFSDLGALEREVAQNLRHGRAFLSEAADVKVLSDCVLVLVHPLHGGELRLPAYVVMVSAEGAMKGTGLEVRPWGPEVLSRLEAFVREAKIADATGEDASSTISDEGAPVAQSAAIETSEPSAPSDAAETPGAASEAAPSEAVPSEDGAGEDASRADQADQADQDGEDAASDEDEESDAASELQLENKQDKLRHLSITDQMKIARTGELSDRIVVERLYGKQVWEALLHNPRLSIPEVARIARKGTVPKPLLEVIIDNGAWIKAPQVRRALFTNPKCSNDAIAKMLRMTPKHELKQIEKSTAYTQQVREAARKLLKQQEKKP